jgi:hypothetical protein
MTTIVVQEFFGVFFNQFFALQSTYFATLFDAELAYYDI